MVDISLIKRIMAIRIPNQLEPIAKVNLDSLPIARMA